ncbi:MAG: MFS transporter [Bacteroidota bacterium]
MLKYISKTVWILSLVSLFTDVASEMLYPVMPIYLKSIGFSIVLIGVLEGLAEAAAGLSKGYFGKLSDSMGRRVPFVQIGYALSGISKPLMAFFIHPVWVFFVRTIDRLGKGIRTGARDALLSDEATPETKGKIFGFHRAMDTLGAAIGPTLALLFLWLYPGQYTLLFYIAFIPGMLALISSFLLKESVKSKSTTSKKPHSFFTSFTYLKSAPSTYKKIVTGLLFFTLFNSSDVFLLLQLKQAGLTDTNIIGTYIFYNLVYAILAFPLGVLADKLGLRQVFIMGLGLFAIVYFGFAFSSHWLIFLVLMFVYGAYSAATEGIAKAWLSNAVPKSETATAIGSYAGLQSLCTLLASSMAGIIWYRFGSTTTFMITGITSVICLMYFMFLKTEKAKS